MSPRARSWLRYSLFAALVAGTAFLLGFIKEHQIPKIEAWLMVEIEAQSRKHLPVRIWPGHVRVDLFPVGMVVDDIRILPQGPLAEMLAPAHVERASMQLSWFALLKGQVRIAEITIESPRITVIDKSPAEPKNPKRLPFDLKDLQKIPIDAINIVDLEFLGRFEALGLDVKITQGSLLAENRFRSLYLDVSLPHLSFKEAGEEKALDLSFETRALLDDQELNLSSLRIIKDRSYLLLSGKAEGDLMKSKLESSRFELRSQLFLEDISRLIHAFRPDLNIPNAQGLMQLQAIAAGEGTHYPKVDLRLVLENAKVDKFEIGNLKTQGVLNYPQLHLSELSLRNRAGGVSVTGFKAGLEGARAVEGTIKVKDMDLHELFPIIGITKIPVYLQAQGEAPCTGNLSEDWHFQCQAKIEGQDLRVDTINEKGVTHHLLNVEKLSTQGEFKVNKEAFVYKSELKVGASSVGKSDGTINFKTGFNINYSADNLDFGDIKTLAELKFEGQAHLTGTTQGDSHKAVMKLNLETNSTWFEDYWVGNTTGEVNYKEGILTLRGLEGRFGDSRYNGNLSINFLKNELFATARMPYVELGDLRKQFARKYLLPIEISGSGSADIRVWGPLRLNGMSFRLLSSFFRGQAAGESFDELFVNASANNGRAVADRVQIIKSSSNVTLTGRLEPTGLLDVVILGRNLRLEQSESIQKAGLDILGQGDFTMSLKGPILSPDTELHGRLSKVVLGDRPFDDSNFQLKFSSNHLQGKGKFLGNLLSADFQLPYKEDSPFRLNMESKNIDITNLFNLFSSTARKKDFESKLTSKVDLRAEHGGFWNSTGTLTLEEFFIRRGPQVMKLPGAATVRFERGVINSQPIQLEGENSFLKVQIENSTRESLTAAVNAKFDIGILSLLTPFLADLRGRLAAAVTVGGKFTDPLFNGSIFIEQGMVQLAEFPHAFENIKADLLLNQKTLTLNALRAELGGGEVTGDGTIKLQELYTVPVDIKGRFKDVSLNVPNGVKTRGSGTMWFKGLRFPYTLGVRYEVASGEVTMEFAGSGSSGQIKPSAFLPKFVKSETVSPVTFDLDIQANNPIPVKNSLVQSPVKGHIRVLGPPSDMRLTGTLLPSPGGKVMFRDTPFEVISGYVEYQNDPPDNPKIYLSAQARVEENTVEENKERVNEYDVNLLVQGRVTPTPQIQLTSQPPLSSQEIVSLLALGMTTSNLQSHSASAQPGAQSGVQITTAILQKPLGKTVKDKTGFDFAVGSDTENVSSPKVTLGKQLSPNLGASASRTIESAPKNNVKLEYKVNRNLSVIGSWETKESQVDQQKETESSTNKLGIDLEYKINFK